MNKNFVPFTVDDYLPKPDFSRNDNAIAVISLFFLASISSISMYGLWKAQKEIDKLQAELEKQRKLNMNLPTWRETV